MLQLQRVIGNKAVAQLMVGPKEAALVRPPSGERPRAPGRNAGSIALKNRLTATQILQRVPRTLVQDLVKKTNPAELDAMGLSQQARTFLTKLKPAVKPWRVYDNDASIIRRS